MTSERTLDIIRQNLARVRQDIARAAASSGRTAAAVQVIAVTKYAESEWVDALLDLGVIALGESRPQQLINRASKLTDDVQWHLIGHLQRNKVRPVISVTTLIHSIDSIRLLDRVDHIAHEIGISPRVLLEVNVSGEDVKDGFAVDELLAAADQLANFKHVKISGLMAMAPLAEDPEASRPVFRRLRELQAELNARLKDSHQLRELSMGMSGDFQVAVEEGATLVRIGRALYDGLSRAESD